MKEIINNLFDNEDEDNILIIPITTAFKHGGDLVMNKGLSKKAAKYYPKLPERLGAWHREYSREPFLDLLTNTLSFPVKLSTKEITNETFVKLSIKKVFTFISQQLVGKHYFIPAYDPLYEEIDVYGLIRQASIKDPYTVNVILVRDIQY